jgi:hypothetical protein
VLFPEGVPWLLSFLLLCTYQNLHVMRWRDEKRYEQMRNTSAPI